MSNAEGREIGPRSEVGQRPDEAGSPRGGRTLNPRLLIWLAAGVMVLYVYVVVVRPLASRWILLPAIPVGIISLTLVFVLFSLAHSLYSVGWLHTLVLFVLSVTITWGLEQVGVVTGEIYGGYSYSELLGPKVGQVPALIPLSWFMMLYPSILLANCLVEDSPIGSRGTLLRVAWVSFISALIMTARDLVIDPSLSGPAVEAWVWEQGGPYFGVPSLNFASWTVTSFLVVFPYRLFERSFPPRSAGPVSRTDVSLALIMYVVLAVTGMMDSNVPALRVIAPFVVGLPTLVALSRVWSPGGGAPFRIPAHPRQGAIRKKSELHRR